MQFGSQVPASCGQITKKELTGVPSMKSMYSPTPEAEGHLSIKVPPHDFAENIIGDETTIICHPGKESKRIATLQF